MMLRHVILATVLWVGLPAAPSWGWGIEVHKLINGHAMDLTHPPLGDFLRQHRERIVELSVDADTRKEKDPSEGSRHYIDFEYYGGSPYSSIPYHRGEAEVLYGYENMAQWGTLPWRIIDVTMALRDAMADDDWDEVVILAADLGHYVADAHQPLHTTVNYDGQLTGNKGIHSMFEVYMVDKYLDQYHHPTPPLPDIESLSDSVFTWLFESFRDVEIILAADSWARENLKSQKKAIISEGFKVDPDVVPQGYLERLYLQAGLTAWYHMSKATVRLAALWLWAWDQAGQPSPP
jgi:hypothetical protein